jgi:hypothetical protein
MKKNRFYILGVLALLLTFGAVFAACGKKDSGGDKAAKETDFVYELNEAGDAVVITGYQEDAAGGDLVIPATIEGYPVTAVVYGVTSPFHENSYDSRPPITSVVFPDSVTEIRQAPEYYGPFISWNPYLTSISFPKDLKEIPDSFALDNTALTAVKWPETLEIIGNGAFARTGFTELVLPEGVREIRDEAFAECENLTTVTIPASIEKIGDAAFVECPVLATVNMPAKTIQYQSYNNGRWGESLAGAEDAFVDCPKLTGIAARKTITDTGYTGGF